MKAWNSDESSTPPNGESKDSFGIRWTRGDGEKVMIYDLPKSEVDQELELLDDENPEVIRWDGNEWVTAEEWG